MKVLGGVLGCVLAVLAMCGAGGAVAGAAPGSVVRAVVLKKAGACGLQIVKVSTRSSGRGWRVALTVAGTVRGTSQWNVIGGRVTAVNLLARTIKAGCPQRAPSPPPTPPPPPPVVPLPATYEFGTSVPASTRELILRTSGFAGGYFRARLGRELPPVNVYVHSNYSELLAAWARVGGGSIEDARRVWSPTVAFQGRATPGIWLYAARIGGSVDASFMAKMFVHEAFHILQRVPLGGRNLGSTGTPSWLGEGTAEYIGTRVVVEYGLSSILFRETWITQTRGRGTLRGLETEAGFVSQANAYELSALAAERLIAARGEMAILAYSDALAQGAAWPGAFRTAFGKTPDAFYEEFEAYRRTL